MILFSLKVGITRTNTRTRVLATDFKEQENKRERESRMLTRTLTQQPDRINELNQFEKDEYSKRKQTEKNKSIYGLWLFESKKIKLN